MQKILIIEDEAAIRRVLTKILSEENETYQVEAAEDGIIGLEKIKNNDYDLVLCDIKMPKMDGVEVLEAVKKIKPEIPMVMISGHGDMETAIQTMRLGAFDYISKPPDLNRLLNTVRNALDKKQLVVENKILKKKVSKNYEMIGDSEAINHIKLMIDKVAPTEARVLITGPNGTGKELVAHQLHEKSERATFPLIEVNCAAIPSELIESELFGHVKGAFTSAVKDSNASSFLRFISKPNNCIYAILLYSLKLSFCMSPITLPMPSTMPPGPNIDVVPRPSTLNGDGSRS